MPSTQTLSATHSPAKLIALIICLSLSLCLSANDNIDELDQDFRSAENVNEGQLVFLTRPQEKPVLHSTNTFTLTQNSINTGWVRLEQCYTHLDKVPDAEIVFQYKQMKALKLVSSKNIANINMTEHSAILKQVGNQAKICISAQVRNFYQNPDKTFSLVNGPYHRQFLDGYYPYHLSLTVNYKGTDLHLIRSVPDRQPGFNLITVTHSVDIDTLFEGKLNTELIFEQISDPPVNSYEKHHD